MSGTGRAVVSVIVAVREHPEPLVELYQEYAAALRARGVAFEFLFAADASYGGMLAPLTALREAGEPITQLHSSHAVGETTLLRSALTAAAGETLLLVPAYRRVLASGLPDMLDRIDAGAEVVLARRWPRLDGPLNKVQNGALHALLRWLLRVDLHDVACGVRAVRRHAFDAIPLYGDNARFLGVIADRLGYRVEEVAIPQHPADVRAHLHPPGVYVRRLLDVIGLFFVLRFMQKPLRFFGLIGALLATAGVLPLALLAWEKLHGAGIAQRPLLLAGVVLVVLGVQMIAIGLIGEIIVFLSAPASYTYRLSGERNPPA